LVNEESSQNCLRDDLRFSNGFRCFAAHTLTTQQETVLKAWLAKHPTFRIAIDADCKCDEDIQQMRKGYGEAWSAVPDYHPYVASGDFNGDGIADFAVIVIGSAKSARALKYSYSMGRSTRTKAPAFVQSELEGDALFFGAPRPKPYPLVIGPFESDNAATLVPQGRTYKLEVPEE
jgi:hypothetical protein